MCHFYLQEQNNFFPVINSTNTHELKRGVKNMVFVFLKQLSITSSRHFFIIAIILLEIFIGLVPFCVNEIFGF